MSFLHLGDLRIGPGDALIVVDVQNDFLPGGSLAAPRGEEVVPVLRRAVERFAAAGLPIFATRDWHPVDHASFHEQGGPWPPHAVWGTWGARFADGLDLPAWIRVVSKGSERDDQSYSEFERTDLEEQLHELGAHHLFVGGIATEYCVLHTVLDALDRDFAVSLLRDGIGAIDVRPGDGERAIEEMVRHGAAVIEVGPHHPDATHAHR
jgi:nicotinamidase/pyrazinamidase